jgi:hypothetical protein
MHTVFNPTLTASTDTYGYSYGINFSPVMNANGDNQSLYPVSITPTFNLNGHTYTSEGLSPALYVKSPLCGIFIEQSSSMAGNSGQPLEIYQTGTSDKNAIWNYRNGNLTYAAFMWNYDNRPVASRGGIVPALRSTINNPTAGGGVSFTLDRVYYGTEASIDMHYETTPSGTTNENTSISFSTTANNVHAIPIYINGDKVGMGTVSPSAQLHTTGTVRFAGLTNDDTQTRVLVSDANGNLFYRTAASLAANDILHSSLAVNGPVRARSLTLSQQGWPDYVFDSSYRLMPLKEVKNYIQQNSHLPGVPSAAEISRDGLSVGDIQATLMKKIEELTLYNIQQEKRIDQQNELLAAQSKLLKLLEQKVDDLSKRIK